MNIVFYLLAISCMMILVLRYCAVSGTHLRYVLSSLLQTLEFLTALCAIVNAALYISSHNYVQGSFMTFIAVVLLDTWWDEYTNDEDNFWKDSFDKVKKKVRQLKQSHQGSIVTS